MSVEPIRIAYLGTPMREGIVHFHNGDSAVAISKSPNADGLVWPPEHWTHADIRVRGMMPFVLERELYDSGWNREPELTEDPDETEEASENA
jgi:hypothetical protein